MEEINPSSGAHDLNRELARLRAENERLRRFLEIGRLIGSERDIDRLIPLIMHETSKTLHADRSTLFLLDQERMELWTKFAQGLTDQKITIDLKMGIAGLSALLARPFNVPDAYEDHRFNRDIDMESGFRTHSILAAPFFGTDGEVAGVIELLNKRTGIFGKRDESLILEAASGLSAMFASGDISRRGVEPIVYELKDTVGCERVACFLMDGNKRRLNSLFAESMEEGISLNLNVGIAGYVAITGREISIEDAYSDSRFDRRSDLKTGYRTRCVLCTPVKNQSEEILGVIQVINKKDGVFTEADLDILRALTPQIAIALENATLFRDQNRQFRSTLEVLAASIDAKDPLTAGHSQKVAEYAVGIGRELGFGEAELDVLYVAGLLHDYGKIGICDAVLKKPGKLTDDEFKHIKKHVEFTRSILSRMSFVRRYKNVPLIASCHHERLDGTGYGMGLKGNRIPFMSRILAVADVFEALTAKRHYRDAMVAEEAFAILDKGVDSHFDANIVKTLKDYWRKRETESGGPDEPARQG